MADLDTSTETKTPFKPPVKGAAPAAKSKAPIPIMIPKTKDATGDVPVSVNGVAYQLKRGVRIDAPPAIVHALENARGMEYEQVIDPVTGRKDLIPQETMSYPFQRL